MYPVELEIKDTTKRNASASQLYLLPLIESDGQYTSIYNKSDGFNFNITNFPFLSNIFHHHLPMVFSSHRFYDNPGLAPHIDALIGGQRDFPISFSNRDTSRNTCNRH